mgnify:CR=1 FL=1|tara:strand:+ start:41 stop:325 length:285 start_codon:yes stop_codon:yes gene_type:complete
MTEIKVNTDRKEFKVIENSKDEPSLEQAQKFVGGYVEGISFPNGDYLIINEEGRLKKLPLNPEATLLWRMHFDHNDIVGPAILIKKQALKIWAA